MEGRGRYGSCMRACPLKLEIEERYGFSFQDMFLPRCQVPFVTPQIFAVYQDLGKKVFQSLRSFFPYGILSKGAVSIPLRSLESLRKAKLWTRRSIHRVSSVSQLLSNLRIYINLITFQNDFNKSCVYDLSLTPIAVKNFFQRWQVHYQ